MVMNLHTIRSPEPSSSDRLNLSLAGSPGYDFASISLSSSNRLNLNLPRFPASPGSDVANISLSSSLQQWPSEHQPPWGTGAVGHEVTHKALSRAFQPVAVRTSASTGRRLFWQRIYTHWPSEYQPPSGAGFASCGFTHISLYRALQQ